ncbi:MAG: cysteine desulfurase family protein [bacterium]|nr:cysteine desulfurase family protein [bacterium]
MIHNNLIYLDYNATTPCDQRVVEKMLPYFTQVYGNPANGLHIQGRMASDAVDEARHQVAECIGAYPGEIYFTSGATESNNIAIRGLAWQKKQNNRYRIITSVIEHKAVLQPCKKLEEDGFEITLIPVDSNGLVRVEDIKSVIDDRTLLITVQTANNEIGTLQPISEIAEIAHQYGALMHTDAAQAVGKILVNVDDQGVDLLSMSAHKLYGPKGVGALYIRGGTRNIPLEPLILGGGQEKGLRSGTTNVPAIVGFGEACQIAKELVNDELFRITSLRDQFEQTLTKEIHSLRINGKNAPRLPNTSSLTFPGIDADALLLNLPEVMMGTGSACTSGAIEPSHVLQAIGLSREDSFSTIRVSLGRFTTVDEIELSIQEIINVWMKHN